MLDAVLEPLVPDPARDPQKEPAMFIAEITAVQDAQALVVALDATAIAQSQAAVDLTTQRAAATQALVRAQAALLVAVQGLPDSALLTFTAALDRPRP